MPLPLNSTCARMARSLLFAVALVTPAVDVHAALHVADSGVGQVLIFPYYTIEGGKQTVFAVENTTARAKAVAIRIREGRNGALVHAMNAYLAPDDSLNFAISAAPGTPAPRVTSADLGCAFPVFDRLQQAPFSSAGYTGSARDHPPEAAAALGGLERTRSGYVEVFDMGELRSGNLPGEFGDEVTPPELALNGDSRRPRNCDVIAAAWEPGTGVWARDPGTGLDLPTGGLRGSASLVDLARGTMSTFAPLVLGGFYSDATRPGGLHAHPTADRPRLADARTTSSEVVVEVRDVRGRLLVETFPAATAWSDPASLVLMGSRLSAEYVVEPEIGSLNEWVLTLPTKRDYVNGSLPRAPFTRVFPATGAAAERIVIAAHDRTGRPHGDVRPCDPLLPTAQCPDLEAPGSVNVLALTRGPATGTSALLGATLGDTATGVVLDATSDLCPRVVPGGIEVCLRSYTDLDAAGRVDLAFGSFAATTPADPTTSLNSLLAPSGRRYYGLPVVAVSFIQFECRSCVDSHALSFGAERGVAKVLYADP